MKPTSKVAKRLAEMPPLRQHFAAGDQEAVGWLMRQPEVIEFIIRQAAAAGVIVHDAATGTWRGVRHGQG